MHDAASFYAASDPVTRAVGTGFQGSPKVTFGGALHTDIP